MVTIPGYKANPNPNLLISDENIAYAIGAINAASNVAIDTETTGFNVRNNVDYLMGFCFDTEDISCYVPFRHLTNNVSMRYLPALEEAFRSKTLYWWNQKFDYHSVKTIGIDPLKFTGKQYDGIIITQLMNEELWSKELDYIAKKFLGEQKVENVKELGTKIGFKNIPPEMYRDYGPQDARLTRKLIYLLWPKMVEQEGLEEVYWNTEQPFLRLLYRMEQRGVGTNPTFCEQMSERGSGRMATIYRELNGRNPSSPTDLKGLLLDELGLPVLGHTDSCKICKRRGFYEDDHEGSPSFKKSVMEDYDDILSLSDNPTAKLITEYRGWQKAVSSLYLPTLEKVGPDGRLRTEFKWHGTVTGRLSSNNPNLQQIPRSTSKVWNGNAKFAFNSGHTDYALYGFDYSQLELRLAAMYGREQTLLTEFESESADPFKVLTPLIFHGQYSEDLRHKTKNGFVYPSLYGAGLQKVALQLGIGKEEAAPLYERYKASIPGITLISEQVRELVKERGFVKYWDGRRRHIRNKTDVHTRAWNSVLQGGASQLVKRAMLRIEAEIEDENCFMVLQVHDEITFCIRRDLLDHYIPLIVHAMTDFPQFGVRFAVEHKEWGVKAA